MNPSMSDERPAHRRSMIFVYALTPIPVYSLYLVMSSWNTAHEENLEWWFLIEMVSMNVSVALSLAMSAYVAVSIRRAADFSTHVVWKLTKIHLRSLFGPFFMIAVPFLSLHSTIRTFSKSQTMQSSLEPALQEWFNLPFLSIIMNGILIVLFVSCGYGMIREIPEAIRRLTSAQENTST